MNKKIIKKFFSEHIELHVLIVAVSITFMLMLCLFLFVKTINEVKKTPYIGKDTPVMNVLPVTGRGEVTITPDIASFHVSVIEEGETSEEAQSNAAEISNAVLAYLRSIGIQDTDIQSTQATVYPKYVYEQSECSPNYCPPGEQTISGYESNQSVTVKVRDVNRAGDILAGLTGAGASNISGPNFTVDKNEVFQQAARKEAIEDAQVQAQAIAEQLGVRLGKVVSFNEMQPNPYYYGDAVMNKAVGGMERASVAPELQTGESTVTSEVMISYEIK